MWLLIFGAIPHYAWANIDNLLDSTTPGLTRPRISSLLRRRHNIELRPQSRNATLRLENNEKRAERSISCQISLQNESVGRLRRLSAGGKPRQRIPNSSV